MTAVRMQVHWRHQLSWVTRTEGLWDHPPAWLPLFLIRKTHLNQP
jgi:hypothetical protein